MSDEIIYEHTDIVLFFSLIELCLQVVKGLDGEHGEIQIVLRFNLPIKHSTCISLNLTMTDVFVMTEDA